ncbi:MAG: hypothetical protein FWG08_01835 [Propionibacteriaceae bacterium]|nr:hypothetical protein [Propionibacteriaceae bacterium]
MTSKTGGGIGTNQHQIKGTSQARDHHGAQASLDSLGGYGVEEETQALPVMDETLWDPENVYDRVETLVARELKLRHTRDAKPPVVLDSDPMGTVHNKMKRYMISNGEELTIDDVTALYSVATSPITCVMSPNSQTRNWQM